MARKTILLLLSWGLLGCSSVCDDPTLPTCDIREPSCQATAQEVVRCLRGQSTEGIPPVSVITPEQLEARLRDGADPMMMEALHWEGALRLLGMLAPGVDFFEGMVQSRVDGVAAFYTSADREISIVDRGEPLDSPELMATLVHELVHAAQDEETGLDSSGVETLEDVLQYRHAVEGEATFYTYEAIIWSEGLRAYEVSWSGLYRSVIGSLDEELDRAESPYFVVYNLFPYVYGSRRHAGAFLSGADVAVRDILVDPPDSSAAWLEDPFTAGGSSAPRLGSPRCEEPPPPEGFARIDGTEMGSALVYAFARRAGLTHTNARAVAIRRQRDDLVWYGAGDTSALAWQIVFDRDIDPVLVDTLAAADRRVAIDRRVLTIVASDDPAALASWRWSGAPGCGSP